MRVSLLKAIDSIAGNLLAQLLPVPPSFAGELSPAAILVIRPGGIGDAVLIAPAIAALAACFPGAAIDILAERRNAGIFELIPGIRNTLIYDRPAELLQAIRGSYDVVIDSEQWHKLSAVVARLTRAPLIIGYGTNIRRRLFTAALPYHHDDYEAVSFCRLLAPLGISCATHLAPPFLVVPPRGGEESKRLLGTVPAPGYVVLFPGASIPERQWGAERFHQVASRLLANGLQVVVVGAEEDCATAAQIVAGGAGITLAGRTTLAGTAAVIAGARVLVSGDSGILHLGVGLNVPTVSLFGPGIAAKWAPVGERHVVMDLRTTCSPCTRYGYTPRCQHAVHCLTGISPAEVVVATMKLLERSFAD